MDADGRAWPPESVKQIDRHGEILGRYQLNIQDLEFVVYGSAEENIAAGLSWRQVSGNGTEDCIGDAF